MGEDIENEDNIDNTFLNKADKEKAWEGLDAGKRSIEFLKEHDLDWGKSGKME
jgi:hypothetical protein